LWYLNPGEVPERIVVPSHGEGNPTYQTNLRPSIAREVKGGAEEADGLGGVTNGLDEVAVDGRLRADATDAAQRNYSISL
jgi:hypothetical protein